MPETIFDLKTDTKKAREQLGLLLKPLGDLKDTGESILKDGGLFGMLMGNPAELKQFEKASKMLKDDLRDQLKTLKQLQQQQQMSTSYEERLRLSSAEDKVAASIRTTYQELNILEAEYRKVGKVSDEYAEKLKKIETAKDPFGDMGGMGMMGMGFNPLQSAGSLAGLAGGLGGGYDSPLSQISGQLMQYSNIGMELQPLADGLGSVMSAIKGGTGITGKATGVLDALGGGMGAMGVAGLAAGAAMTTLNMAMQELQKRANLAIEMRQRETDAMLRQMNAQREYEALLQAGDYEGAKASQEQRMDAWEDANAVFNKAQADLAKLEARWAEAAAGGDILGMGQLGWELDAARQAVADATANLGDNLVDLGEMGEQLADIKIASQVRELDDALAGLAEPTFLENLSQAANNVQNTRDSIKQLADDFVATTDEMADDLAWAAERQRAEREREDTMELTRHIESQLGLIEDSHDRETEINQEFYNLSEQMAKERAEAEIDALAQLNDSLDSLADEYRESRQDTIDEYDEQDVERVDSHEREIAKMEDDYNRERVRRLQDLQSELNKAERANDVLAFIDAQERGTTDLNRMKEDHDLQMAERQEEFDREREQSKAEHEQRLEDMQTEAEERRQELLETYDKEEAIRNAEYDERLAAEEAARDERLRMEAAALDESLIQAEEAFQKEKKLKDDERAWNDEWDRKERERSERKRQESHDAQMAALQTQLDEELAIIQEGYDKRAELIAQKEAETAAKVAQSITGAIQKGVAAGAKAAAASGSGAGGSAGIPGWAKPAGSGFDAYKQSGRYDSFVKSLGLVGAQPGVVTDPTLSMLGERPGYGDLVIPFPNNQGVVDGILSKLGQGGSGGNVYNYHGDIGNGMTRTEVNQMFQSAFEAMFQELGERMM